MTTELICSDSSRLIEASVATRDCREDPLTSKVSAAFQASDPAQRLANESPMEDLLNGWKKRILPSGAVLEEQYLNSKLIYEILRLPNGRVLEGQFKEGRLNGQGKITFKSGEVHEGQFENGHLNGQGKITFKNGEVREGQFSYGCLTGKGKISFANGVVHKGQFESGLLVEGVIIDASRRISSGTFKNGLLNGKGKQALLNGQVYSGEFRDGFLISDYSDIGNVLFGQLLTGRNCLGAKREFSLGILAAFLARNPEWVDLGIQIEEARNSMIRTTVDPDLETQHLINQLKEGRRILLTSGVTGHAVMVSLNQSEDGNEFVCVVHNAGDGILHHPQDSTKKKYQTNLVFKIASNQCDAQYIKRIIMCNCPSMDAFYQHVTCNGSHQIVPISSPIWQSAQKGSSCTLKSALVFLRFNMPEAGYKKMKRQLCQVCMDQICRKNASSKISLNPTDQRVIDYLGQKIIKIDERLKS